MKIKCVSDIHLEFSPLEILNPEGADVLILSGDILVVKDLRVPDGHGIVEMRRSMMYYEFIDNCCAEFEDVIYIMGNHEHYHGDYKETLDKLRQHFKHKNLHILEKESVTIKGVTFIGGTLWTDMNKEDPHTLYSISGVMNDFKIVDNGNNVRYFRDNDGNSQERKARLMPEDVVLDHKAMLEYIKSVVDVAAPDEKFVVVGHHAPTKLSTKPKYAENALVNGAYSSDLSEFILDRPKIKLWTHGHTHNAFDYMIGSTRIVCNPRGYDGYEDDTGFDLNKIIEL